MGGILYQAPPRGLLSEPEPQGLMGALYQNPLMARQVAAQRAANPRPDATDIFGYGPTWQTYSQNLNANLRGQLPQLGQPGEVMIEKGFGLLGNFGLAGMARHAKRGGEEGINEYFYKGGQFLPNTTQAKFPAAVRAGKKAEIEPFKWLERPIDGVQPLMKDAPIDWPHYKQTGEIKLYDNPGAFAREMPEGMQLQDYYKILNAKVDAFRAGARWVDDAGNYLDAAGNPLK